MEITIFKEVTTEGVIASIEENSKKYHDGLYANMNNLPERTMVKKGAAEIGDIIKELKASRIKITKANTAAVNKEHDAIVERLAIANKPFTDLLDAYNVERKKELDIEKARKQAIEDAQQKENDHEMALLIDKTYAYDREQELKERAEIKKEMQRNAQEEARAYQEAKNKEEAQHKINEENARLANKEHCGKINRAALADFTYKLRIDEELARKIIGAIAKNEISNIQINY